MNNYDVIPVMWSKREKIYKGFSKIKYTLQILICII